jgi:hypothetical protein
MKLFFRLLKVTPGPDLPPPVPKSQPANLFDLFKKEDKKKEEEKRNADVKKILAEAVESRVHKILQLDVSPSDPISTLKRTIAREAEAPIDDLRVMYQGLLKFQW